MKSFYIIGIIFLFLLLACNDKSTSSNQGNGQGPEFSWLSTDSNKIVNEMGEQVLLYGVNRSGLEYDQTTGNGQSNDEYQFICEEWKASVVRLPFNQEWVTDADYLQLMDNIIGWIKSFGAYVILDLQWQNSTVRIPPIPNEDAVAMWQNLAGRYKNDPAVLYDIHNEAHDISFNAWKSRASQIIEAIQAVHPKALILVSGLNWAQTISTFANDPLPYPNIVYSAHVYTWIDADKTAWENNFGKYADQIPIFVGELGGYDADVNWGNQLLNYLDQKKIGWTAWSWVDDPHLTESDHRTATAFGQIVKSKLLKKASPASKNEITNLQVTDITSTQVTIRWTTSLASDTKVLYGLTTVYDENFYASAMVTQHIAKLSNLQATTTYHYKIISVNQNGVTAESTDYTFTTSGE